MKKIAMLLLALLLGAGLLTACITGPSTTGTQPDASADQAEGEAAPAAAPANLDSVKIGFSTADLANPIFAEQVEVLKEICDDKGWEFSAVACDNDAGKQITQIENFISGGVDVLVVSSTDPQSMEEVLKQARAKGILIVAGGQEMPVADVTLLNDNQGSGYAVGAACGQWITERYGEGAAVEVAMYEYTSLREIKARGDGMEQGLAEHAPNATIVARASAVNVTDGMSHAETIFQANPEVKAFMCIGDGGGLGACEVMEAKGFDSEDYGVFSVDGTEEALVKIANGAPQKLTVSQGSGTDMAHMIMEAIEALLSGDYEEVYYTPVIPINAENVGEYLN